MSSIRSSNTKPERVLRAALWKEGLRGFRCHWPGPEGRIDVAFTRWKVAVFVDGSFWHGHPSKWQPDRWSGYWDEKIKRNMARDKQQTAILEAAGWRVLRFWDFDIEHDPNRLAAWVKQEVESARLHAPQRS